MSAKMKKGQQHDLGADHVHVGTWMDRPGESHEWRMTSRPTGLRLIVHVWHDGGEGEIRVVDGDAWRDPDGFCRVYAETLTDTTTDVIKVRMYDVLEYAAENHDVSFDDAKRIIALIDRIWPTVLQEEVRSYYGLATPCV